MHGEVKREFSMNTQLVFKAVEPWVLVETSTDRVEVEKG